MLGRRGGRLGYLWVEVPATLGTQLSHLSKGSPLPRLPLGMSAEVWRQPAGDGQLPHGKPWPQCGDVWGPVQGHIPLASHPRRPLHPSPPAGSPQAPPSLERLSAGSEGAELAGCWEATFLFFQSVGVGGTSLRCSAVSQVRARQWGGYLDPGGGRRWQHSRGLRAMGSQRLVQGPPVEQGSLARRQKYLLG